MEKWQLRPLNPETKKSNDIANNKMDLSVAVFTFYLGPQKIFKKITY